MTENLTESMLRALAWAVDRPGRVTTRPATIDALVRRGLVEADNYVYGQRAMRATDDGKALIASLGGPDEAKRIAKELKK